jgi:hypothetical protein
MTCSLARVRWVGPGPRSRARRSRRVRRRSARCIRPGPTRRVRPRVRRRPRQRATPLTRRLRPCTDGYAAHSESDSRSRQLRDGYPPRPGGEREPPIWAVLAPRLPAFSAARNGSFCAGHASIGVGAVCSRCGPSYDVGDAEVPRLVHLVRREGRLAGVDSPVVRTCPASRMRSGAGCWAVRGPRTEQPGSMRLCRRHQRPGQSGGRRGRGGLGPSFILTRHGDPASTAKRGW